MEKETLRVGETKHLIHIDKNKGKTQNYYYNWCAVLCLWVRGEKINS